MILRNGSKGINPCVENQGHVRPRKIGTKSMRTPVTPRIRHRMKRKISSEAICATGSRESEKKATILVADIGGTNCRFQVWDVDDNLRVGSLCEERVLPTSEYARFDQALEYFLKTIGALGEEKDDASASSILAPRTAAFAVAGPVKKADGALGGGRCEMTNLGWIVDAEEVQNKFGIISEVLNDFEAIGYGVPVLDKSKDVLVLNDVGAESKGPIAVLGPGTGLGQCQLFWDKGSDSYIVHPSEGSHSTFAPRGWKQRALQAAVEAERGHCSVERVACGSGLVRIYEFLRKDQKVNSPPTAGKNGSLHEEGSKGPTPAAVSQAALDGSDPIAQEALDIFLAIVGAEAGHMALRSLSTGGVYIAGGIFPKVIDRVKAGGVLEAFLWKESRFHEKVLKHTPLFVVLQEKVGLLGSRERALALFRRQTMFE